MNCRNCEAFLNENSQFCPNCGELVNAKRLKVKSIIELFFSNFFSVDNKFLRTFKDLTIKPEVVIDSYVHGYRKKYVNVIGYLGLAVTLIGFQFFVLRRFFPELLALEIPATPNNIKINNDALDINSLFDSFYQYQGLFTILFIPLYAFASKLIFLDSKKYNLAEHFIINIYTNAHFFIFWFVFTLITLPLKMNYNLFSQFSLVLMFIYMTYTFKRLYSLRTFESFLKVILYFIIAFIVMIGISLIFAVGYGFYLAYSGQITPMNTH
nr:DUF3667 domain-containing protein [uncultured Psychroserpens sp.]